MHMNRWKANNFNLSES